MKKLFFRLAVIITAFTAILCAGAFTGCGGSEKESNDYVIVVCNPDGSKVNGSTDGTKGANRTSVLVQFCTKISGTCTTPVALGADGTLKLTKEDIFTSDEEVELHLLGLPDSTAYTEADYIVLKPEDKPRTITVTLHVSISK